MNWFESFWKPRSVTPTGGKETSPESNFTPRAQQVLVLAREESNRLNHNYLGTEHVLLGLIKLGQGVAVHVLQGMGIDLETVSVEVEKQTGRGPDQSGTGHVPYTPRVKKVLDLARREAKNLNHTYIGTEHLFLGLLREGGGIAAQVLKNLGVDIEEARRRILKELDPNFATEAREATSSEMRQATDPLKRQAGSIDTSRRYDIYCSDSNKGEVVYRNALFKGRRRLLSTRELDTVSEFLEIEQSNGQIVYLSLSSVRRFCEHGTAPGGEIIPPQ